MNKRLIASILILLLVLTMTVVSYATLSARFAAMREAIRGAVYAESASLDRIQQIEQEAKQSMRIFSLLVDRRDLSQLLTQIQELRLLQKDANAFRQGCVHALRLLDELERRQKISLENIL